MRVTVLIFLPIIGSLSGCGTITALGYEPFVRNPLRAMPSIFLTFMIAR